MWAGQIQHFRPYIKKSTAISNYWNATQSVNDKYWTNDGNKMPITMVN